MDLIPAYTEALAFLKPYLVGNGINQRMCWHNYGLRTFDYENYLKRSLLRYRHITDYLGPPDSRSWLDIGGFLPAFPIALSLMGFSVTVVEDFTFYPSAILSLYKRAFIRFGIRFIDANFTEQGIFSPSENFDIASCLALLEHLPHTPRYFLQSVHQLLCSRGLFFCEVPNYFYWGNILKLIKGKPIHAPIEDVYNSGIPFTGHHREYTAHDLEYVLSQSSFNILERLYYNYSATSPTWKNWPAFTFKSFREVMLFICRKD